jgi:hypothetical protein
MTKRDLVKEFDELWERIERKNPDLLRDILNLFSNDGLFRGTPLPRRKAVQLEFPCPGLRGRLPRHHGAGLAGALPISPDYLPTACRDGAGAKVYVW